MGKKVFGKTKEGEEISAVINKMGVKTGNDKCNIWNKLDKVGEHLHGEEATIKGACVSQCK